jgi:short-subunit dehydrogenase
MKVQNKIVLVTGAGSGMGRQLALELIRRGASVALVDFRKDTLDETEKMISNNGGKCSTHVLDVSDRSAVAKLPGDVKARLGEVDVLINNAGIIQPFVKINELTLQQADHVMEVNFSGPLSLIKAFLPGLLARPSAHILNVSSMGAYAPVPGQSVYGASKAALKLLTEGLRSELTGTRVNVTIAFPGAINTNIAANSGMAVSADASAAGKFKMTEASVAAKQMIEAIEKNKARICIGQDSKIMDIMSRINPVWAAGVIYKQMASLLK